MRGKQTFRKLIQRMPSGKFRWVINGDFDTMMASGVALSKRLAREAAITEERRLICAHEHSERIMRSTPRTNAFGYKAMERAHYRETCARKSQ